jgi:hypothetical protein
MLVSLPPAVSISDALRFLKSNSSGWIHDKWQHRRTFAWQLGYGAFSVSKSNVPAVLKYIRNQEAHHHKISFKEEFVEFLEAWHRLRRALYLGLICRPAARASHPYT